MGSGALKGKEYHGLCEALFKLAQADKENLITGKSGGNASRTRLDALSIALREMIANGLEKLTVKTIKATIDHFLDILPEPDRPGEFYELLASHYTQTLTILLSHNAHVEFLARSDAERWFACVDLLISRISRLVESTDSLLPNLEPNRRESPLLNTGHGSSHTSSNGRPRFPSQRGSSQLQLGDLTGSVQCLSSLVSAVNAPCKDRYQEVSGSLIRVLRLPLGLGRLHRAAFAALNSILLRLAGENTTFGKDLTRDLLPLISYWWQPRTLDNDELLSSVRDEMLKTMHAVNPYLDSLLHEAPSAALLREVEDLLDTLWCEYSQRSVHSRLRLDDLTFSPVTLPSTYFRTSSFTLRPFSQDAERRWVVLEIISQLEDTFLRHTRDNSQRPSGEDEQPRKKRRIAAGSSRIEQKLHAPDIATKLTAVQLIPFFLPWNSVSGVDVESIVDDLVPLISDKQGLMTSWAMLAAAR